jgi:heme exporter protein CcmB
VTSVLRAAWLIARKDLRVESRSRELAYTAVFFAVSCVLVFAFALMRADSSADNAAAGVLWVTVSFSGTLALGRTFERERNSETLRALLLAPVERAAVYLGKLIGLLLLLVGIEVVIVPVVALIFHAPVWSHPLLLAALLISGTIGYLAVGTLFAAMLVRAQSRDVLLPVLLYPMTVPVLLGGAQGTALLFSTDPLIADVQTWLLMLVSFDLVFLTVALWSFAPVMAE